MSVADGSADLRALARSIEWVNGIAFFFVVVEDLFQRDFVVRRIEEALQSRRPRRLAVGREITNLLDEISRLGPFAGREALFVTGLEHAIRDEQDTSAPIIRNLNASRDLFRSVFDGPIVFVVPPHVVVAITLGAPDFFSTRSGVFSIDAEVPFSAKVGPAELLSRLEGFDITGAERSDRIATLLDSVRRLRALGAKPAFFDAADRAVGLLAETRDWKRARELALEAYAESESQPRQALRFLVHLVRIAQATDQYEEARKWIDRAAALAYEVDDEDMQKYVLRLRAILLWNAGDLAGAEEAFQHLIGLAERDGERNTLAYLLRDLGLLYAERGDRREAAAVLRQAIAEAEHTHDEALIADIAAGAAANLKRAGFTIEAEEYVRRSLAHLYRIGDAFRLSSASGLLGEILHERGQLDEAESAYAEALSQSERAGLAPSLALPYAFQLMTLALDREDAASALKRLEAVQHLVDLGRESETKPDARERLATAQRLIDEARPQLQAALAATR